MRARTYRWLFWGIVLSFTTYSCEFVDLFDDFFPRHGDKKVDTRLIASGMTSPVDLETVPGDDRLFVVDQTGLIHIIENGQRLPEPFLDIRDRVVDLMTGFDERGLLSIAFHPDYPSDNRFFVYYSAPLRSGAPAGWNNTSTVSEFRTSDDPNRADAASERIILEVDEPQFNHAGGDLAFGPEGYLYISLGDGGGANDVGMGHEEDWYEVNEGGNAQNITANLLGKILRIDIDNGDPYGIPPDNPFVGQEGLDEIYAFGLRNPYRMNFDRATGKLYTGDVGQNLYEEVNIIERGGNYGWNVKEGASCFNAANNEAPLADCPDVDARGIPLTDPIVKYKNAGAPGGGIGLSVIGGFVYRGDELVGLEGRYVFGDFSSSFQEPNGILFFAIPKPLGIWSFKEISLADRPDNRLSHFLKGIGEDNDGELYILVSDLAGPTGNTGAVYKLFNTPG